MNSAAAAITPVPGSQEVLQRAFRAAMGNVASAVSVVTTFIDGKPHGATVSAFMSLSMDPPMVVASLDRSSTLLSKLTIGAPVGLNVLAAHQDQVGLRFAGKGDAKFTDIPWQLEQGAPALVDRHAWLVGRVAELVAGGDHILVLVDILHAETGHQAPLTYWQRTFGTHHAF
ncbi:flavin reductase family protein [Aeromicrobium panaciterrae]|uniref:flavin reductase family protein n=1 Tax=Aeromicrobium panaciterrae TaxID=363861 RepID=UPI0031D225AA